MLLVVALLTTSCGGGSGTRTAQSALDDVLRLFRPTSIDEVAAGRVDDLSGVFRRNATAVDEAFDVASFRTAVDDAALNANGEVQSRVRTLFAQLDAFVQQQIDTKLRTMICEARLYAQNQTGDVELFRPWIEQEFAEIQVRLGDFDLEQVGRWLTEKVNDKTSLYSLACMAWVRAGG